MVAPSRSGDFSLGPRRSHGSYSAPTCFKCARRNCHAARDCVDAAHCVICGREGRHWSADCPEMAGDLRTRGAASVSAEVLRLIVASGRDVGRPLRRGPRARSRTPRSRTRSRSPLRTHTPAGSPAPSLGEKNPKKAQKWREVRERERQAKAVAAATRQQKAAAHQERLRLAGEKGEGACEGTRPDLGRPNPLPFIQHKTRRAFHPQGTRLLQTRPAYPFQIIHQFAQVISTYV